MSRYHQVQVWSCIKGYMLSSMLKRTSHDSERPYVVPKSLGSLFGTMICLSSEACSLASITFWIDSVKIHICQWVGSLFLPQCVDWDSVLQCSAGFVKRSWKAAQRARHPSQTVPVYLLVRRWSSKNAISKIIWIEDMWRFNVSGGVGGVGNINFI